MLLRAHAYSTSARKCTRDAHTLRVCVACAQSVAACGTGSTFCLPLVWAARRAREKVKGDEMRARKKERKNESPRGVHLIPPDPRHPRSTSLVPLLPLPPGILLSRDPPVSASPARATPLSGWLSGAPAAGSHTRCPHAGRDVTRAPPCSVTSRLLASPSGTRSVHARITHAVVPSREQVSRIWVHERSTRSFIQASERASDDDDDDALLSADLWPDALSFPIVTPSWNASFPAILRGFASLLFHGWASDVNKLRWTNQLR